MKNNFEALLDFTKSYSEDDLEKHTPSKSDWIVEGYAATSDLDAQNHIINQDALNMGAECLKKYDTVLYNHDMDRPIGVIKHVESQPGKLFVKVAVSKSEPKIWQQVQDGTLSKFSIRGRITDSEVTRDQLTEKQILVIKGMDLHETSIVSVPANIQAKSLSHYIEKSLSTQEDESEDVIVKINTKSLTKSIIASIKSNITEFLNLEKKEEPITIELTNEVKKGGIEEMDEVKKDEVKAEEIKKSDEEIKKSDEVTLNVGALREVITQFQGLAKTITDQSATVQALVDSAKKDSEAITKTKEEMAKIFSDLNELVKEIPLRKAQPAEKDNIEDRKNAEDKDFTKTDEYKKLTPMDQLHKLFSVGLEQIK